MLLYFAAMIFESCTVDTKTGNILTSPQLTLLSDLELTFTMVSVPSSLSSNINIHKTSIFGRIGKKLGSVSATFSGRNISADKTYTICLPTGTYRLVFIASDPANVIQSTVALTQVLLTDSACTYTLFAGNWLLTFNFSIVVKLSKCKIGLFNLSKN